VTNYRSDGPPTRAMQDDDAPPASGLSSMQRAIMTIQRMRAKIEGLERAKIEAIAIVGMACRFPGGANSPEDFLRILEDGVDAITEVPPGRWPLGEQRTEGDADDYESRAVRWGAFLDGVDEFDARFFGISPREAISLDPQQRVLLEVAWEALERGGQVPERLMGSRSGVFIGLCSLDYQRLVLAQKDEDLDAYCFTGNLNSTAAGRVAYSLGLQGPCMIVDTACSSSLVAIHLACQSLRSGECNLALAGGVNLMLAPDQTLLTAKSKALSADGRCKTFDARANGYVRGEGCGVVVLKRLSDAERDGDAILAVIRGSAVNQDGRSTGLTAPNVLSQEALLRQALENARVAPMDVGYIETHGTGTALGDPIEVDALRAVFGGPRETTSPCVLGAVKSNIGHLEPAAGVAGLIKAVMVLKNERIPPNLHFRTLNPRIKLKGTPLVIPQQTLPFRAGMRPRIAGVSSFGISGTNAHIVIEEGPRDAEEMLINDVSTYLLPISAKNTEALRLLAKRYQESLVATDAPRLLDFIHTASIRRGHHEHRLAVVGSTREDLADRLAAFSRGDLASGVVQGKAAPARAKVVFVFSGQGSQWLGMGKKLYEEEVSFRLVIESCDALLMGRLGWSILDEIDVPERMSRFAETEVAQPMIFAIQVALAELFRTWGIVPDAVIGHSVGEIAAAHVAGILTLDEAVRLVAMRSKIMQEATGEGKMVSAAMTVEEAKEAIVGKEARVAIAAVNDGDTVVLSGAADAVDEIVDKLELGGVECRPLRVNYAFHSPQMDTAAAELLAKLARVDARRANLAMYSTVLADCVDGAELDASYWSRNVRETVNLKGAVEAAIHDGYQLFLEVGPHPVLAENVRRIIAAKNVEGFVAYSLRRNQDDRQSILEAAGGLYTRGCSLDWAKLVPSGGKCVPLPTYPWQRERFWVDVPERFWGAAGQRKGSATAQRDPLDAYVHVVQWRMSEAVQQATTRDALVSAGGWLIFADASSMASSLVRHLQARGESCVCVFPGERYERIEPGKYRINPGKPEGYQEVLRDAFGKGTACRGVVHSWSLDATPWDRTTAETLDVDQRLGSLSVVFLVQALLRHGWRDKPKLWLVTRGAQCVGAEQTTVSVSQAPLWGLGRTIALEHPELACALVDLPPAPTATAGDAAMLLHEMTLRDREDRVALRPTGRYVARLATSTFDEVQARELQLREDATYWITGGLGGLGMHVARWMVAQGARHIALTGRSAPSESAGDAIREMEEAGAQILVLRGDVSRADDVARMVEEIQRTAPSLRGIVHAAGTAGEKRTVLEAGAADHFEVLAPKTRGAWNVHEATLGLPLDFFVLYSSASAILGLVGHGGYGAANAFLDALAEGRTRRGLPAMSIEWGAFADVGLAARGGRGERMAGAGLGTLASEDGPRALGRLLERPRPTVGVFRLDVRQWLDIFPHAAASPFWSDLQGEKAGAAKADEASAHIRREFDEAAPRAKRGLLEQHLREQLAKVFRMNPARIDITAPFSSMGADSLMSLEVKNRLERSLGLRLPATLLFTYPTASALVDHLLEEIAPESEEEVIPPVPETLRPGMPVAPIAAVAAFTEDDLLADFDATMQLVKGKKP
jgi:acyl transferase domain-containing protein